MNTALIAAVALSLVAVVFLILALLPQKDSSSQASQPQSDGPSVAFSGSVVTIRHAGSSISVQMSGPEPVLGPLSDMSIDTMTWDRVHDPMASEAERDRCIAKLREQGFTVTKDGEEERADKASEVTPEFFDSLDIHSPDDGPAGELVYGPLSDPERDLHVIMQKVMSHMKSGRCTPAFAKEIAQVYHISLRFRDAAMEEASRNPDMVALAHRFSDEINRDVDSALEQYDRLMRSSTSEPPKAETPVRRIVFDGLDWSGLHKKK